MEAIDEFKTPASATTLPMRTISRDANCNELEKYREEGELSSSSGDDACQASPVSRSDGSASPASRSAGTASPASRLGGTAAPAPEPIRAVPVKTITRTFKAGSSSLAHNPPNYSDVHSQSYDPSNYNKSFEKSQIPYKSSRTKWFAPSRADKNLVISFSDDDSRSESSDSEDGKQKKATESIGNAVALDLNRKPPISLAKPVMFGRPTRNESRMIPRKAPFSRRFVSLTTKFNGTSYRGGGSSIVGERSYVRNHIDDNKFLGMNESGTKRGRVLDDSKLQDLREQIAIRETELKLKSAKQSKESCSFRNYNYATLNKDAAKRHREATANVELFRHEKPAHKHIKVSKSDSDQPKLDNHANVFGKKSMPVREESDFQNINGRCSTGADTSANCIQSDRSMRQEDAIVSGHAFLIVDANAPANAFPIKLGVSELNHSRKIGGYRSFSSLSDKPMSKHRRKRRVEKCEEISGDKSLNPVCDTASLHNRGFWNSVNAPGSGNTGLKSLIEIEELQEKELEEAQEHRLRCEIDERKALKAYRKAQRALVEANAKCNILYRQRELYSAQFRSLIMEDSSLLWSARQHENLGIGLNSSNDMYGGNGDLISVPNSQMWAKFDFNPPVYGSNLHYANGHSPNTSYQHTHQQNVGSEPCSELDASTSEISLHMGKATANIAHSPFSEPTSPGDEDDTFLVDHISVQPNADYEEKRESFVQRETGINENSIRNASIDSYQDSLLLEASLRSKLFERLGNRTLQKKTVNYQNLEPVIDKGTENDVGSEKLSVSTRGLSLSEADEYWNADLGGSDNPKKTVNEASSLAINNQSMSHVTADPMGKIEHWQSISFTFSPASILRTVFGHVKVVRPAVCVARLPTDSQQNYIHYINNTGGISFRPDGCQRSSLLADSLWESIEVNSTRDIGSYTCNLAVDPFWPLCMFELRGKCNDDECSWQHIRGHSNGIANLHDGSNGAEQQIGSSLQRAKFRGLEHCWKRSFDTSLAVTKFLQRNSLADCFAEAPSSWNRHPLFFENKSGTMDQLKNNLTDTDQSLEMAILILKQETDKSEGTKRALFVLSRALEADPKSVVLWVAYILIYYSNRNSIGKNDMFIYAIKQIENSYELWLLFINSRRQLEDRLVGYDTALSALSRHAPARVIEPSHISSCILDLFVQMLDCLCVSGNVDKALEIICQLIPNSASSDELYSLSLSPYRILLCLTVSEKSVFWVCCVYLVIYKKVPDAIIQQFEWKKDIASIEWPFIDPTVDFKQLAKKLMDMAMDSLKPSDESADSLRPVHLLALNHIKCLVALHDSEASVTLLEKYVKSYPSCVELTLISARLQKQEAGDLIFTGFKEAIRGWPREASGSQCIWYQYAENALQNRGVDFVKELMLRWFSSVWTVEYPQDGGSNAMDVDDSAPVSDSKRPDLMFGLLNLSLHRFLQNDLGGANKAINRALKVAPPEYYKHCVREHAMFLLSIRSKPPDDTSRGEMVDIINRYSADAAPIFGVPDPLTRKFVRDIKKPRVQQLMNNMLVPIPHDYALVNAVLEVYYGPTLLPRKFRSLKDLVDFAEAVMERAPSNYQLAFSVCKCLIADSNASNSTSFWACSLLVNSIFEAVPVAPEYIWVEASNILGNMKDARDMLEMFHERALSAYPFSIKLWRSYLELFRSIGNPSFVVEMARERGIRLV